MVVGSNPAALVYFLDIASVLSKEFLDIQAAGFPRLPVMSGITVKSGKVWEVCK